jgi:hypothetical protein
MPEKVDPTEVPQDELEIKDESEVPADDLEDVAGGMRVPENF